MVFQSKVERWTLAVGQGLFHYEEIWFDNSSRPMTIIYDAGTFNKTGRHSVAGISVNLVIERLREYGENCLDYLVLSHYHLDHFSLINKVISHIHVNHFIAPLLTPEDNFFEIISTIVSWREGDDKLLEDVDVVDLAQRFVEKGTEGFVQYMFKNHDDKYFSEKPDISDMQVEQPDYHNEPTCIFITDGGGKIDRSPENILLRTFPDHENDQEAGQEISDSTAIVIRSEYSPIPLWTLAFYYYKPNSKNIKLTTKYCKQFKENINNIGANTKSDSVDSFREVVDNFLYTTLKIPKSPRKAKEEKIKKIFGDSNMNMTSLCMYSGLDDLLPFVMVTKILNESYFPGRNRSFSYKLSKLVSTYSGSSFKMPDGENSESLRVILKETERSKKARNETLKDIYDSDMHYIPDMIDYKCPRGASWAWLGLGDINFSKKVADDFINHFGDMLDFVGCCSAPHHGSYNGFQSPKVPEKLSSAICIISCDPSCKKYGHPHSQALKTIVKSGMIPVLVDKRTEATFHETIEWS